MGLVVSEKKIFLIFPIVSLWDLSVAMETTILIQSAPKPNTINPPTQLWFTFNLIKIGLLASEIFFFEIVDGRTTTEFFSYCRSMETIDPRGVAKFDPRGMIGTIYVEDH